MANVLKDEKKQQIIALGRLGWSLRKIQEATRVRRETISAYLRGAGVEIWPPGRWRRESKAKPAIEVITGSEAAKPAIPGSAGPLNPNPSPNPENLSTKGKATATSKPAIAVITDFGVGLSGKEPENSKGVGSASTCEPYRKIIELGLSRDRNAMAIWQDLVAIERRRLSMAPHIRHLTERGNARQGFFADYEVRSVLANLPSYLKDFALFAYLTGWRRGEIASLRWEDVDGDVIRLRGENSKNGDARSITLDGELAELMERRKSARQVKTDSTVMLADLVFHLGVSPSWISASLGQLPATWRVFQASCFTISAELPSATWLGPASLSEWQ